MKVSPHLERLIQSLSRFPGVGKKTATRLAWHIIGADKSFAMELAENITIAAETFRPCSLCNMLSESDPCPICSDESRQNESLCIVQNSAEVQIIENMNEFNGYYFVLGALLSPLDGIGPDEIHSTLLFDRIESLQPGEIILALKPSAEGEATMHYIWESLRGMRIEVTRLSTGLPFGSELEYSSSNTLKSAWQRRYGF